MMREPISDSQITKVALSLHARHGGDFSRRLRDRLGRLLVIEGDSDPTLAPLLESMMGRRGRGESLLEDSGREWTRYEGARGGRGWKNARTGAIIYQEEDPNASGGGKGGKSGSQRGLFDDAASTSAVVDELERRTAESPEAAAEIKAAIANRLGGGGKKGKASRGEMVGARREGGGKDARVVLADGSPAPVHVKPSMVSPDWQNVQVSLDPEADVVVTARDKSGRAKTVYSDSFHMKQAAAKFARTQEGLRLAADMHEENQRNRQKPALREHADCSWLMQEQATRPGSESDNKGVARLFDVPVTAADVTVADGKVSLNVAGESVPIKDKKTRAEILRRLESGESLEDSTFWLKSHGATTLEGRHVVEGEDGAVYLRFVGKESVWHNHRVRSPELAKMLLERKKAAGDRNKLFNTSYDKVTEYAKTLDGGKFTPKDFRTQRATRLAIEEMRKMESPADEKAYKAQVKRVAEVVSSVLGNEPAQALESYIDPSVFTAWRIS